MQHIKLPNKESAIRSAKSYKKMCKYVSANIRELAREALYRNNIGVFAESAHYFETAVSMLDDVPAPHAMVDSVINAECLKLIAGK